MMPGNSYFITGTDTGVGKTVASAWALLHLKADYWKPVQSGLDSETDTQAVKRLIRFNSCSDDHRFHPSIYELPEPLSPP